MLEKSAICGVRTSVLSPPLNPNIMEIALFTDLIDKVKDNHVVESILVNLLLVWPWRNAL